MENTKKILYNLIVAYDGFSKFREKFCDIGIEVDIGRNTMFGEIDHISNALILLVGKLHDNNNDLSDEEWYRVLTDCSIGVSTKTNKIFDMMSGR